MACAAHYILRTIANKNQKQTMTKPQIQFLELLKAGLWGVAADAGAFRAREVDWRKVLRIASEQAVAVVVMDGIETLPQELWPPKEMMMKLMMLRMKTGQMHLLLNSTLSQIVGALDSGGVPSVLLKGQGVAQNYRIPESRSCGDLDVYVGNDHFTRAVSIVAALDDIVPEEVSSCAHHAHLSIKGVEVEIHRLADYMVGQRCDESFQNWTRQEIDANFGTFRLRCWENHGTPVFLPTPTYDSFFILHHALRHMVAEGVGFRQICDWTMFLHRWHKDIDFGVLAARLKEFHMMEVWREFGALAVNVLGLPADKVPFVDENALKSSNTAKLLNQIFISGNFGHFDKERKSRSKTTYIRGKLRSFRYQSSRLLKLSAIFPDFCFHYAIGWLSDSIKKVVAGK